MAVGKGTRGGAGKGPGAGGANQRGAAPLPDGELFVVDKRGDAPKKGAKDKKKGKKESGPSEAELEELLFGGASFGGAEEEEEEEEDGMGTKDGDSKKSSTNNSKNRLRNPGILGIESDDIFFYNDMTLHWYSSNHSIRVCLIKTIFIY